MMGTSVEKAIQKLIEEIRTAYVKNPHIDKEHRLDLETATAIARYLWSIGYEQNNAQRGRIPSEPYRDNLPLGFGFKD